LRGLDRKVYRRRTPLKMRNTKYLFSSGKAKLEKKESEMDYELQVSDLFHKRSLLETPSYYKPREKSNLEHKSESDEQNIDPYPIMKALNQITVSVYE